MTAAAAGLAMLVKDAVLVAAARLLTVDDAEAPADYLVVLGGGLETRPFKAAELHRRGMAPTVVIFEYLPGLPGTPSQTAICRRVLEHEKVPAQAIVEAPGLVRTSWDEAQSLRRFLTAHRASRVVIVTSVEHTRRAHWAFDRALSGLGVDVRTAGAPNATFDETNWWKHDEGVLAYLHEYLKLPFYVLRYRSADAAS